MNDILLGPAYAITNALSLVKFLFSRKSKAEKSNPPLGDVASHNNDIKTTLDTQKEILARVNEYNRKNNIKEVATEPQIDIPENNALDEELSIEEQETLAQEFRQIDEIADSLEFKN